MKGDEMDWACLVFGGNDGIPRSDMPRLEPRLLSGTLCGHLDMLHATWFQTCASHPLLADHERF